MRHEKIPLILFSGGADSSAVLSYRLTRSNCDVLYINGHQSPDKIKMEMLARKKVISILEKKRPYRVINDYDLRRTFKAPFNEKFPLGQMPYWVLGALTVIDPERHSCLDVGYVLNDDVMQLLSRIETAWNSCVEAFFGQYWDNEEDGFKSHNIPLTAPFRLSRKEHIYERLNSIDPALLDAIWVCEKPKKNDSGQLKPCGECPPCEKHQSAAAKIAAKPQLL